MDSDLTPNHSRTKSGWRSCVALAAMAVLLVGQGAFAREVTDATGRTVTIPDAPARVFAAGPPAATLLYTLSPDKMIGWVRAPKDRDLPYLLPSTHDLPELGRLTGKGGSLNLEVLLAAKPDLIVDFGTVNPTYIDLANNITEQTGIPFILIDGSFDQTPEAIRAMAKILGVAERGEMLATSAEETISRIDAVLNKVPTTDRPLAYLARGPEGLEAPARGSINAEIVERVGAVNVVQAETKGLVTPSLEQVIAWAPDTIVTIDQDFAATVAQDADWQAVPAVTDGRVFLAPAAPFGFIDSPPSVNRLIGVTWLLHQFYPHHMQSSLRAEVQDFYKLFYQVDLDEAALDRLLVN